MYYVVMTADRKLIRDVSDNRFAAVFTTREAAQRVADHSGPGATVMPHLEHSAPFDNVMHFA